MVFKEKNGIYFQILIYILIYSCLLVVRYFGYYSSIDSYSFELKRIMHVSSAILWKVRGKLSTERLS